MALPRAQRVRRHAEFASVRAHGTATSGRLLTIATLRVTDPLQLSARFGFTVTRRVGNAVTRNRVRRRLASIIASAAADVLPAFAVITIPRPAAATAAFDELRTEWLKVARRAGILRASVR